MPYIKEEKRIKYMVPENFAESVGDLNCAITNICLSWINDHGMTYTSINDVIGVLECAKQEFYRRLAAPYEDKKIKENGDIY